MISLLQLQYFLAMAEEGHLTRTAEKLYVSQSTLSSMISKLENELGVELFDRKSNRMVLNAYGQEYRRHIETALDAIAAGDRKVKQMAEEGTNRLAVAVTNTQVWHEMFWLFQNRNPDVRIQVFSEYMEQNAKLLMEEKIDFIMGGEEDMDARMFDWVALTSNRLCLCVPRGHRLEGLSGVYLKEIENEPYIELSPGMPYRNFCDRLYQKLNVRMNTVIECGADMRHRLVREGYGVAITNDVTVNREMFKDASFVPIKDEVAVRVINLAWRKGRSFTPAMQVFFDYAQSKIWQKKRVIG